jgi:hypothetical protein
MESNPASLKHIRITFSFKASDPIVLATCVRDPDHEGGIMRMKKAELNTKMRETGKGRNL